MLRRRRHLPFVDCKASKYMRPEVFSRCHPRSSDNLWADAALPFCMAGSAAVDAGAAGRFNFFPRDAAPRSMNI
jgi:hypothetical protein